MCLAQGPQRSDAGEAQNPRPLVSSQALYHWATALPIKYLMLFKFNVYPRFAISRQLSNLLELSS